jgi:hypothetical protein
MGKQEIDVNLVGKPLGKGHNGRRGARWEDKIKKDLYESRLR